MSWVIVSGLDEELFFTGSWLQYLSSWMTGSPPSPPRVRRGLQIVQMDHYSQGAELPLDIFVSVLAEEFCWLFGLRITLELIQSSLLERCDLYDEWWINSKMIRKVLILQRSDLREGLVLQRPHRVILMHIQHFDSRGNEEMEQMLFSEQKS